RGKPRQLQHGRRVRELILRQIKRCHIGQAFERADIFHPVATQFEILQSGDAGQRRELQNLIVAQGQRLQLAQLLQRRQIGDLVARQIKRGEFPAFLQSGQVRNVQSLCLDGGEGCQIGFDQRLIVVALLEDELSNGRLQGFVSKNWRGGRR